eukprot:CAMPEP_0206634390 /NCGR_PEP_ID=MMETSP0325_2-20121206/70014_1 /ASSEMBLY_ACC=CAM_ASM_000347 /TAXON_ID=2866 /ORGANISM="Crypthecodinium cohnii, Strain Seligo" /LENGTH=99 /DNA_ID=CAMNT_0054160179 /DNA_START=283 /DNA_END=582 /DNA_ORIENTATION=-
MKVKLVSQPAQKRTPVAAACEADPYWRPPPAVTSVTTTQYPFPHVATKQRMKADMEMMRIVELVLHLAGGNANALKDVLGIDEDGGGGVGLVQDSSNKR